MGRMRLLLLLACLSASDVCAEKRIALTFDDVPRKQGAFLTQEVRQQKLISALKRARVKQAAFFINPGKLTDPNDPDEAVRVMAYAKAGHVIANHSFTHIGLSNTPLDVYLADIDMASAWIKGRKGYRPWYRFTFLDEGRADKAKRDDMRAALKARGLRNGYVTVEASDWNIEDLTLAAAAAGNMMDQTALRDLYVQIHVEAADFYDDLAVKAIGRSPVHVMLLHETDIAALYVEDLVAALRKDGWTIVTADKAYADPIASAMPDVPSAQGTLTEALAWEKGLPPPRWYRYNNIKLATALFNERVLKEVAPK